MTVANKLNDSLSEFRVIIDDRSEVSPGFKFNEWEQKGVPLRVEVGPKDIEKNSILVSRRDDGSKNPYPMDKVENTVKKLLNEIQDNLYRNSESTLKDNTTHVESYSELIDVLNSKKGFVSCFWNENKEDELKIKEETSATLRCYPLENTDTEKSINSDSENGKFAIFSKAY